LLRSASGTWDVLIKATTLISAGALNILSVTQAGTVSSGWNVEKYLGGCPIPVTLYNVSGRIKIRWAPLRCKTGISSQVGDWKRDSDWIERMGIPLDSVVQASNTKSTFSDSQPAACLREVRDVGRD